MILAFPLENRAAIAQQNLDLSSNTESFSTFNHLVFSKLKFENTSNEATSSEEVKIEPLTMVEENMARNLDSHWVWPEYTLEMIDSYSPFLFRTKKSQDLEEVKVIIDVDSKGEISGFDVVGKVDKGLQERLDHMIRKMPKCKPVPGYSLYSPSKFELTIKK